MLKKCFLLLFVTAVCLRLSAQNTLPDFSLEKNAKGENIISWRNPFGASLIQLTVQRSVDSVKNFKSIFSFEKPAMPAGNYAETPIGKFYYKISYMLQDGSYFNTSVKTVASGFETPGLMSYLNNFDTIYVAHEGRTVLFPKADFQTFRDSVLNNTSDTLKYVSGNNLQYIYYIPVYQNPGTLQTSGYRFISNYMYLNQEGNPVIRLPSNDFFNYSMVIYDRDGRSVLYNIAAFESNELILSKANFLYSGLYPYELKYKNQIRDKNTIEIR